MLVAEQQLQRIIGYRDSTHPRRAQAPTRQQIPQPVTL